MMGITQALDVIPDEDESEPSWSDTPSLEVTNDREESVGVESSSNTYVSEKLPFPFDLKEESLEHQDKNGQVKAQSNRIGSALPRHCPTTSEQNRNANVGTLFAAKFFRTSFIYLFVISLIQPLIEEHCSSCY